MATRKEVMRSTLEKMLRDLKTVYTDTWFLPADKFAASVDAWYKALGTYSYDSLKKAFDEYVKTHDRPPMPSQIRELVFSTESPEERTPQFDPALYWQQYHYYVLLDLEGYHINEFVMSSEFGPDDVADWLRSRGWDLTGTILRPVDYATYEPKYHLQKQEA